MGNVLAMGGEAGAHTLNGTGAGAGLFIELKQVVDVENVIKLAVAASKEIMEVYNSPQVDWSVEAKADSSPVTLADKRANAVICDGLMRIAPHIPIVSEENKQTGYDIRQNYEYCWCVDPLDGTKEFLKKTGEFTVNIALLKKHRPVMGVVLVPTTGVVYFSVEGAGAFKRENGTDTKLQALPYDPSATNMIVVASASHLSEETKDFVSGLKDPSFTQLGSSLKLVMVAEGKAHVYPRLAPTCEWDTAAAHAIVIEAGGSVKQAGKCDNKGKALEDWKAAVAKDEDVIYNKPDTLNPYFIVYGRR